MKDPLWSKNGTAYMKDGYIYSYQEAARRGFVTKEEADKENEENDED
jgi:hypothetical protein